MTCRVLVVNGNRKEKDCLVNVLTATSDNILVSTAETWREAVVLLETCTYDCALLDYALPDVSGIALLRMLHNEETGMTELPVIMTARREQEEGLIYALRCGAQGYLLTDYLSPDQLVATISNNINAFKILSLAKEVELRVRSNTNGAKIVTQLTDVLVADFEKFREAIVKNVTANDAGDADVLVGHRTPGSIYWVY